MFIFNLWRLLNDAASLASFRRRRRRCWLVAVDLQLKLHNNSNNVRLEFRRPKSAAALVRAIAFAHCFFLAVCAAFGLPLAGAKSAERTVFVELRWKTFQLLRNAHRKSLAADPAFSQQLQLRKSRSYVTAAHLARTAVANSRLAEFFGASFAKWALLRARVRLTHWKLRKSRESFGWARDKREGCVAAPHPSAEGRKLARLTAASLLRLELLKTRQTRNDTQKQAQNSFKLQLNAQ